mmetsp:Transcript_7947/g.17650  ORF Transcript_7947/g.17650 Transcript_7947/m.17650 type:complete len:204 (+) Transcript_7947:2037-2648(+)
MKAHLEAIPSPVDGQASCVVRPQTLSNPLTSTFAHPSQVSLLDVNGLEVSRRNRFQYRLLRMPKRLQQNVSSAFVWLLLWNACFERPSPITFSTGTKCRWRPQVVRRFCGSSHIFDLCWTTAEHGVSAGMQAFKRVVQLKTRMVMQWETFGPCITCQLTEGLSRWRWRCKQWTLASSKLHPRSHCRRVSEHQSQHCQTAPHRH